MKKITDERLILRNLKNIRITYIVQTIGILCILGYEFFQGGLDGMRENPLWMVFILTSVVSAYLSMSVSVEHEKEIKNPKKSLIVSMVVLTIIVVTVAYLISITPNFSWIDGLLLGAIVFICGFIPLYYVYRLRVKQEQNLEDE
ncbi:hypothetical protein [Bacillus pseudomycoides]|uniref:hypothetical protein n=1 Tax=Bacillus pseudomycoides TaxID=64104 RepID=UPI000BED83A3|nr:hypothetical protein [Bacillus pseudomycoides]PEF71880.1 hypothetical protein CON94_29520 [Bacillus pseudomycoides]PEI49854.1 hypothetical protein CN641_04760 [Bacillus pseudomycoides]PEL74631.1 hypothetical protein CN615_28505 [Bacillus pseudomycoides]PGA65788.1 hypothetical protein COL87_25980 [Bacillus pseudomycoides]PHA95313.1 hypothetical protein COE78_10005 [Bacillus pseudomycoides]